MALDDQSNSTDRWGALLALAAQRKERVAQEVHALTWPSGVDDPTYPERLEIAATVLRDYQEFDRRLHALDRS